MIYNINRLRYKSKNEKLSEKDKSILQSRIKEPKSYEHITEIFGRNKAVNQVNKLRLNDLKTKLYTVKARHIPKERKVKINEDGTIENTSFFDILHLKEGARVMLISNINTTDKLVNGVQGIIQNILSDEQGQVRYVIVSFDNKSVGKEQKHKFKFLNRIINLKDGVPIERVNITYTLGNIKKNHGAKAAFLQLPLKLSWSITSHKVI